MTQITFFDDDFNTDAAEQQTEFTVSPKDWFSGCYRYRECSDAGKCVVGPEAAACCAYNDNLMNGRIFFGKNANDFDKAKYRKLENTYKQLTEKERHELNCFICYFQKHRSSVLWYNSPEINQLNKLGFIILSDAKNYVLEKAFRLSLLKFISEDEKENIKQEYNLTKKVFPQALIIDWLNHHRNERFEKYTDKFVYVSINKNMYNYIFELYFDYIENNSSKYLYHLPLNTDPIFKAPNEIDL